MAEIGNKWPTLIDVASRSEFDGTITKDIVELLAETNPVLDDAVWYPANDGSTHKTTIRSGLPEPTWRMLNYGVQPTKSTTVQIRDATGMLEAYAEVDKSLADLNGNTAEFRLSEDEAHIEGMNQGFVETLFYGNTATQPARFMGLAPRFSSLSAENADNIINAGGVGADNTSIWLVVWGPQSVHGIYPKGSPAGLQVEDKGQVTLEDINKGKYEGYRTHYKWDCGLTVRDWRYVVRIANIDVSNLTKNAATGADITDLMVQAIEMLPAIGKGRPVFYAGRTIGTFLRRQTLSKANVNLMLDDVAGKKVLTFDGIPVRRTDAILSTEAAVA